jgi:hypothetical protein
MRKFQLDYNVNLSFLLTCVTMTMLWFAERAVAQHRLATLEKGQQGIQERLQVLETRNVEAHQAIVQNLSRMAGMLDAHMNSVKSAP